MNDLISVVFGGALLVFGVALLIWWYGRDRKDDSWRGDGE